MSGFLYGGAHSCPRCGHIYPTADQANHCNCASFGAPYKKCPQCGGSGQIVSMFGPNITCERCGGKGEIPAY